MSQQPLLPQQQQQPTSAQTFSCHESLHLYISSEAFTLEPVYYDVVSPSETCVIDREKGTIRYNVPSAPSLRQEEVITIYGIIGMIKLNAGDYLIVVTDRSKVGRINGHDVYRLTNYRILRVPRNDTHLSDDQKQDDNQYLRLIRSMLDTKCFYFSYAYDLTSSAQRQLESKKDVPLWKRADERFFWNKFMMRRFIEASADPDLKLGKFILPLMLGFVEIQQCFINENNFTFALISRRSVLRAGTRYNSRGVDSQGNVSNNVETEQIIVTEETKNILSYLQTRGSMPLFWRQDVNVKYVPKLVLESRTESMDAFRKHFLDQINRYGPQVVINLINKKGYEKPLGDEFARMVNEMNDSRVKYIHFDFHHECRKMQWHRIGLLVDQIAEDLLLQGYFHSDPRSSAPVLQQTSACRTNCMDCLDRTNVVQSVLARVVLTRQLQSVGILRPRERVEDVEGFERVFKNVWADNADAVSTLYSGTGALKTDFTRTGKRTRQGLIQDGINSAVRYVKNNFYDGYRQDAFDLFLGNYVVIPARRSPFKRSRALSVTNMKLYFLPLSLLFSIFMLFYLMVFPMYTGSRNTLYMILFMITTYLSLRLIFYFGPELVDQPHLVLSERFVSSSHLLQNSPSKQSLPFVNDAYEMKERTGMKTA